MHRFRVAILLACIVMLTACGDKTDLPDATELLQTEAYSTEKDNNNYEVIVADSGADIIPGDDVFSAVGIREAKMGRDTDEALAGIGYCFYDVDGNGIEEQILSAK